jgi:hypothetical protein
VGKCKRIHEEGQKIIQDKKDILLAGVSSLLGALSSLLRTVWST